MTKLSHNLGMKVFACFLAILSVLAMIASGFCAYYANEYNFYSGQATPYHKTASCQKISYQYAAELIDQLNSGTWGDWESEAFAAENTNYRCVIVTEFSDILLDNMTGNGTVVLVSEDQFVLYTDSGILNSIKSEWPAEASTTAEDGTDSINVVVESYITEPPTVADDYWNTFWFHQTLYDIHGMLLPILLASALIFAAALIYLLCAAGHRAGKEEIIPNLQDKIPLDLYLGIVGFISVTIGLLLLDGNSFSHIEAVIMGVAGILTLSILALATILTCATRIKLGRYFYQNTITYKLFHFGWKLFAAVFSTLLDALKALPSTWKVAVVWLVISSVYVGGGFGAVLLSVVLLFVFCTMAAQMQQLKEGGEALAKGNLNNKINTDRMFPMFRKHGENLNSISKGFSIALDQKMKSERLKTELITNVSHDIKTPLTSIINYVDLLKKENLEGQAAEYIEVLDRQTRRLKKLTEDLVEASKASTGNLKVDLTPTDMGELVAQAVAEYEEKLEKAKLEVVINGSKTPVFAMVDGNLTWRVFSNLLSNACKYSQTGTRVYIDIKEESPFVTVSMKNISKDALNIPAEELMERFVRGDSSRHTEGSGLGLNIAQSLVGLQKGNFTLEIEGDLFKAYIKFPAAEPPVPHEEEKIETTEE